MKQYWYQIPDGLIDCVEVVRTRYARIITGEQSFQAT